MGRKNFIQNQIEREIVIVDGHAYLSTGAEFSSDDI